MSDEAEANTRAEADLVALMQQLKEEALSALADDDLPPDMRRLVPTSAKLAENNLRSMFLILRKIEDPATREFSLECLGRLIVGSYGMATGRGAHRVRTEVEAAASANGRRAAKARHNRAGGANEKRAKIRAIWAEGNYSTKDKCADQEHEGLEMGRSTAIKALRGAPDPSPWPARGC